MDMEFQRNAVKFGNPQMQHEFTLETKIKSLEMKKTR